MWDWWFTEHSLSVLGISPFLCGFLHLLWSNIFGSRILSASFSLLLCAYISHSRLLEQKLASISVAAVETFEDIFRGLFSLVTGFCGHRNGWNVQIYFASCHGCASKTLYTPKWEVYKGFARWKAYTMHTVKLKFPHLHISSIAVP